MPDLAPIQAALASIKVATDIAKFLRSANLSLEKAESKMKLAELMESLSQVRIEIAGIQEVIIAKDQRIRELQQVADVTKRLKYEAPFYWLADGDRREGPFCQQCWDKDGKLIRLQRASFVGSWSCMTCKNLFR
jgi:hypothetical protein